MKLGIEKMSGKRAVHPILLAILILLPLAAFQQCTPASSVDAAASVDMNFANPTSGNSNPSSGTAAPPSGQLLGGGGVDGITGGQPGGLGKGTPPACAVGISCMYYVNNGQASVDITPNDCQGSSYMGMMSNFIVGTSSPEIYVYTLPVNISYGSYVIDFVGQYSDGWSFNLTVDVLHLYNNSLNYTTNPSGEPNYTSGGYCQTSPSPYSPQ